MKSDGLPTYLLADIAYHRKKLARGFDELCDIWGADHHGHIARMQAALKAFGYDPAVLRVILIQIVSLLRNGQPVDDGEARRGVRHPRRGHRARSGRDATRFFYLMRRHDTPLEFDLELAKKQSMDNPVYYVQYGARALRGHPAPRAQSWGAERLALVAGAGGASWRCPRRSRILRRLADFPDFVADAAAAREPHRLTTYLTELAGEFQSYYTQLQKVHGDTILPQERQRVGDWRATWNWRKTAARLWWVEAIAPGHAERAGAAGRLGARFDAPQRNHHERRRIMTVRYTAVDSMEAPALLDVDRDVDRSVERWREKIEIRLDNRQVFFLFFGSAVVACMLFVLGVMVGKRIESRGQAEAAAPPADPLAALDRVHQPPPGVAAPEPALTFPRTLSGSQAAAPPPKAKAAPRVVVAAARCQAGAPRNPSPSSRPPPSRFPRPPTRRPRPPRAKASSRCRSAPSRRPPRRTPSRSASRAPS